MEDSLSSDHYLSMCRTYFLVVVVMILAGCEKTQPIVPSVSTQRSSPTGQFDWLMQRLQRAVLDFRPSQRAGLRVGRPKITHELFAPDDERAHYAASITIESNTAYVHDQTSRASEKEKKRKEKLKREKNRRKLESQSEVEDPLAEKFMEQMDEIAAEPRMQRMPDVTIENQQASDRKTYDLAYLKGRWQLQTELETVHEKLWFEYALGTAPGDSSL